MGTTTLYIRLMEISFDNYSNYSSYDNYSEDDLRSPYGKSTEDRLEKISDAAWEGYIHE